LFQTIFGTPTADLAALWALVKSVDESCASATLIMRNKPKTYNRENELIFDYYNYNLRNVKCLMKNVGALVMYL
jgi:hypothetical protein